MVRQSRPSLDLLKDEVNLVGIEIGVQAGINAKWMLQNLDIKKLYLIDPYEEYRCNNNKPLDAGGLHPASPQGKENCKKLLKKWEDKIEYIYKFSWNALNDIENRSVDFVYIDGDHRTEAVRQDLEYIDKIKLGGLLCGHDWRFQTVQKAINQFVDDRLVEFICCDTIQKVKIIDKQVKASDWWIQLPSKKSEYKQKCRLCQKVIRFGINDVEWLRT